MLATRKGVLIHDSPAAADNQECQVITRRASYKVRRTGTALPVSFDSFDVPAGRISLSGSGGRHVSGPDLAEK